MRRLNKYLYKIGLKCERRMWEESRQEGAFTEAQKMRFRNGEMVGEMARTLYPNGVLVDPFDDPITITKNLIEEKTPVIFEAGFEYGGMQVRADILEYVGKGQWDLTEVKSKKRIDRNALADFRRDLAPQVFVISKSIDLRKIKVKHIGKDYQPGDISSLFSEQDLTGSVAEGVDLFESKHERLKQQLLDEMPPKQVLKPECRSCAFFNSCWPDFPEDNIFHIPRLSSKKLSQWIEDEKWDLKDIDSSLLTEKQGQFYASYKKQGPIVDRVKLKGRLSSLKYPISYLDFESVNPVIPLANGSNPSSHFVFQYSIHREEKDDSISHYSFLEPSLDDPRPEMARRLLDDLGPKGSIVSHNARFEKGQILELAQLLPEYRDRLLQLEDRFWDTEPLFRDGTYIDWRLKGGSSIKAVLPLLVDTSYEGLDIQDGSNAQAAYMELLTCTDPEQKLALAANLEKYCKKDTEAMLEVVRALRILV